MAEKILHVRTVKKTQVSLQVWDAGPHKEPYIERNGQMVSESAISGVETLVVEEFRQMTTTEMALFYNRHPKLRSSVSED